MLPRNSPPRNHPPEKNADDEFNATDNLYDDEINTDRGYLPTSRNPRDRVGPAIIADDDDNDEGMESHSRKENNSDEQLERDEKEVIDQHNILGRVDEPIQTRHASKNYKEPDDDEGLPDIEGTGASNIRGEPDLE